MKLLTLVLLLYSATSFAQKTYRDSIRLYQQDYISNHEVVKGNDRTHLQFFDINEAYKVRAQIEKPENAPWFTMASSGPIKNLYNVYAVAHFTLGDSLYRLQIYQSQSMMQTDKYRDHLFLPFRDATSGIETYAGGRYLDLSLSDIRNNYLMLDFNKAYNPYCAYVSDIYSCPVPPKENALSVRIPAGEKIFTKKH